MNQNIIETLAAEALKHIDMEEFAKKLAPKLMKEMETSIMREVKDMEWSDFVYEVVQSDELIKSLRNRIIESFKAKT